MLEQADEELEVVCGRLLAGQGLKLALAESCTGGLVGHRVTEVSGSSAWFVGGILCYDDAVKSGLLGVDPALIREHGAVSAQCAAAMAQGALRVPGASISLAITGIAGPTGARPGKPVGTTYIALATADRTIVRLFHWHGNRSQNKAHSASAALELLRDFLGDESAP